MRRFITILLLLALVSCTAKVLAWGTTGHRVIAEIAERNLNKKARKNVKSLLDDQHMAFWANWPDFIKSDTTKHWDHTHIWHFVNAPAGMNKDQFVDFIGSIKQDNVYSAINDLTNILGDKSKPNEERKEALVFLIHLMGDMHQPMHTGREEDRGGNRIKISWFGQATNLHSLWDSKLVDYEKYSYTEYATVLNVLTKKEKKALQEGVIEDWLYDSHLIANEVYSSVKDGDELSFNYMYKVSPIVNGQLQKAGLRLAKLLNDLF